MQPNPVGIPVTHVLSDSINEVVKTWTTNNPSPTWWKKVRGHWIKAISFLVAAGDFFIRRIDDLVEAGPDKKATVLAALGEVYDKIVAPYLPFWLKPFNTKIKKFVIEVVASIMIDFFVGKYRVGNWVVEPEVEELGLEEFDG